jgi:hypothetical protein
MNEDILNQLGTSSEEPTEEVKIPDKKKSTGKQIDDEVIASMIANGDNTDGMFTPDESEVTDEDEDLHEEIDEDAKLKTKGEAKPSEKYATEFQKDLIKNPENYMINTPKGEMTVKEAIQAGYDPITKRFNNEALKKKEDTLNQLNDKDRAAVEKLFDPSQLGLAPADAEGMGIKPDSPMVRTPMSQPSPAQAPTPMSPPTAGPAPSQGAPDINALLGGNV